MEGAVTKDSGRYSRGADVLAVTLVLAIRFIQIFAVVPSSIIGILVLWGHLSGAMPVRGLVEGAHVWAGEAYRGASEGMLWHPVCRDLPEASAQAGEIRPVAVCKESFREEIAVSAVVGETVRTLSAIYLVLVIASVPLVLAAYPGRRFFGLSSPHLGATSASSTEPS